MLAWLEGEAPTRRRGLALFRLLSWLAADYNGGAVRQQGGSADGMSEGRDQWLSA